MTASQISFGIARVLVVGDVMLDRYWHGPTSRISPEAPVPVVHVGEAQDRPGGAANVAINIAALGSHAELVGLVGDDEAGRLLERALVQAGVRSLMPARADLATITKLRVLSRHQQLIRLDFEDGYPGLPENAILDPVQQGLARAAVLVLSDYGKGTLRDAPALIAAARAAGVPVLVDPKGRDFTRYRGATLITPNAGEFEAVAGAWRDEADLEARARRMAEDLDLEAMLVTRSEHGMSLVPRAGPALHLPARAREVYDVTGAGDTVIAVLAAALAAGEPLPNACAMANTAAGIVVGKLGAATVTSEELHAALHEQTEAPHGVVSEAELAQQLTIARARGERVVMTNGCFDILHAGHVSYLDEARALGDRLVVAVNSDDSVRRLKGATRPMNSLAQRMAVLAALRAVDWVLPFEEDTPERLICALRPDVLVKGGDYSPDEVAGGACVREGGGEVVILGFVDGCSTSGLIRKIQEDDGR